MGVEHVDAAARALHSLDDQKRNAVLDELSGQGLWATATPSQIGTWCANMATLIDPPSDEDEFQAEQRCFQRRYLKLDRLPDGMWSLRAQMPEWEGQHRKAALTATAETLRVQNDGFSTTQRHLDALIAQATGNATTTGLR
ncbi:MAG: hypothetical protein ACOYEV_10780 [Candidatus Nanopelagicales bacterium]